MAKILVVEEAINLRTLYRKELEAEGYAVVTAGNDVEALDAFQAEAPDLVVLDLPLPDGKGFACMGKMLRIRRKVPIVASTGCGSESYQDRFDSWAADAFVEKSSDTRQLRTTIRGLLGSP